jgi:alpha/beta superfamily hydrolase
MRKTPGIEPGARYVPRGGTIRCMPRPSSLSSCGVLFCALIACSTFRKQESTSTAEAATRLPLLRAGHKTKLIKQERDGTPPATPPSETLRLVRYPSPAGQLAAYVTPKPAGGTKSPAVLWIQGGFDNGIGDSAWRPANASDDQSARAFREAGLVLMLPSFRGGNDNPGHRESFYGEVDDALAAAEYLAKLDYVDPGRIYLGGHSTGATLALLVAASTDRFRAVFAFGPSNTAVGYGQELLAFDVNDPKEAELRAPETALGSITTPTFVIEGTLAPSNAEVLPELEAARGSAPVHTISVARASHFSVLSPGSRLLAKKIRESKDGSVSPAAAEVQAAIDDR